MELNGIVLINKERGVSSNFVVNKVKHILKANKAGHYGTLDVLGEGLLPVALGKGTKLFDYFLNKDKVYRTTFKFGETTATLDLEGEITERNNIIVSKEDILNILPKFVGKISQMPPQYSAKKINGRKAYELAREGKTVNLKPKEIEIYSIKLLRQININTFEFEIWCSSGTFIRSICRDLASELGTYGVMYNILRTKCGIFALNNAVKVEDIKNENIIKLDEIFDYSNLILNEIQTKQIINGMSVQINGLSDELFKCYDFNNEFLGIAQNKEGNIKLSLRLI